MSKIQKKLTIILVFIVAFVIFFTWFFNATFSVRYYISSEKKSLVKTYKKMEKVLDQDVMDNEKAKQLLSSVEGTDPNWIIANVSEDGKMNIYATLMLPDTTKYNKLWELLVDLYGYMSEEGASQYDTHSNDLEWIPQLKNYGFFGIEDKGYTIKTVNNLMNGSSDLILFGVTDKGYLVAIQRSIDDIRSSARINSIFLAYVGIIGAILGAICIYSYVKRFTRPITEMAHVANQMTNLDFDAKVKITTEDELGELATAMNQMSEKLESTIAELKTANLELQEDIQEKEQIDAMRTEFLSHVSHELKTPIALIQGYAEGLRDNVIEDEDSKEFYCEVIMDEAKKMNQMVRKLLTLNQIEFGNSIQIVRFNLTQMILYKIKANQILFQKKNIKVIYLQQNEPWYVWGDEFMIEEVVSNYLSNALNHVYESGVIRIWLDRQGDNVRTHVFNQGKPIPEEDLDKLWRKFYKVDKARTREYGGNGIGLSIVEATMKAHEKAYGVVNHKDGVEFYFELEAADCDCCQSS